MKRGTLCLCLLLVSCLFISPSIATAQDSLNVSFYDSFDLEGATRIVASDQAAFIAMDSAVVMLGMNASNEFELSELLHFDEPIIDLALNNAYLFAETEDDTLLHIYVIDPVAWTVVSEYSRENESFAFGFSNFTASPDYLFLELGHFPQSIRILSLEDPENLADVGSFSENADDIVMDMVFSDDYLYLVHPDSALVVCDASNPLNIQKLGDFYFEQTTTQVAVSFPYVLIGYGGSTLSIVDATNPASIQWVTDFSLDSAILDICIQGDRAYVLRELAVDVIDIQEMTNPENIAYYHGLSGNLVASTPEFLFVVKNDGIAVYDVNVDGLESHPGPVVLPILYSVKPVYPNPFNPSFKIEYAISQKMQVSTRLYDVLGCEVGVVYSGVLPAGVTRMEYRNDALPSGIYFLKTVAAVKSGNSMHVVAGINSLQKIVRLK